MFDIDAPATNEAATELLERFAVLSGKLGAIGARRDVLLGRANAAADKLAQPLKAEMAAIAAVIETWWGSDGNKLLPAKRKSIELGGCMIGSKTGKASLQLKSADFAREADLMRKLPWAEPFVRVSYDINKTATRAALAGPMGAKLKARGFFDKRGAETFFIEPVAQAGAVATS